MLTTHLYDRLEFPRRDIAIDTRVVAHIEDGEAQDPEGSKLDRWLGKWRLTLTIDRDSGATLRQVFDDDEDEAVVAEVRLRNPVGDSPRASGEVCAEVLDEDQGIAALIGKGPLMFVSKKG